MKLALWAAAALPWLLAATLQTPTSVTVIIVGDVDGYLAPCGCTKPQRGGIRRMAAAVRAEQGKGRTIFLYNGNLSGGLGRQNELKLETLAETLGGLNVDGVNLGLNDARLGSGSLSALSRFTRARVIASQLAPGGPVPTLKARSVRGFEVIGLNSQAEALARSAETTTVQATIPTGNTIVLMQGTLAEAKAAAGRASLVVYRSSGDPPARPVRQGGTVYVTPGAHGMHVISITWNGSAWTNYRTIKLEPRWVDDAAVSRIYASYLRRVSEEELLEQIPRRDVGKYIGTRACASCHDQTYKVWRETAHAEALRTLERDQHDRDPDCTSCHVVGLKHITGFQSRAVTPDLANVGCESCHGPGKDHALRPTEVRMKKIDAQSCMQCHVPAHSPKFDYATYWEKIRHDNLPARDRGKPVESPEKSRKIEEMERIREMVTR